MNKGINPYVKPGRQRPLPKLPTHSIPPTLLVQPIDQGQPTHPIPKPRVGQGTVGLRRKFKTYQPIPLPKQMPAQPIIAHVPKAALSVPEAYGPITRECATPVSCYHTVAPTSTGRSFMHYTTNRS